MDDVRFPAIPREEMSAEQAALYDKIASGPRAGVRGPYNALLRAPELCGLSEQIGAYVRYRNSLPNALKEMAILVTARHWTAQYEWYAHRKIGEQEGLSKALCDALARGERPAGMSADQTIVFDFVDQMLKRHAVDDDAYARMKARFGERGVLDLIYLVGHYCTVAFILNIDRHPLPADATPLAPLT
jgi:4-carboxymuconolactone decarboxylase